MHKLEISFIIAKEIGYWKYKGKKIIEGSKEKRGLDGGNTYRVWKQRNAGDREEVPVKWKETCSVEVLKTVHDV